MNSAKKLTLDEIRTLPKASVIWYSYELITDEGIMFHSVDPLMVCAPGDNGRLIGGGKDYDLDLDINKHLFDDPCSALWDSKPCADQLNGISGEEYDAITEKKPIVFKELATAITSRRYTFIKFCELIEMDYIRFWNKITGYDQFDQHDISAMKKALLLNDGEIMEMISQATA